MPRADSKCQSRLLVTDRRGSAFQDLSVSLFPPVLTFLRCLLHSRGFDLPTLRSRSPFHSRRSPEVLDIFAPFAATPCVPRSGTATALTLDPRRSPAFATRSRASCPPGCPPGCSPSRLPCAIPSAGVQHFPISAFQDFIFSHFPVPRPLYRPLDL